MIVVPAAKDFISEELVRLWDEFVNVTATYSLTEFTIYFRGDKDYYDVGNLPRYEDLLCVINYKNKSATYYINGKLFATEKDYIAALKNIAFL